MTTQGRQAIGQDGTWQTHRALSLVFVLAGLKSAECLQMWVEPAARRQRSSPGPGSRYEPRVSAVRGPGAPRRAEMSAGLRGGDGLSAAQLAAVSLG